MGPTRRAFALASSWPTMPLSWPDHNYGVGPPRICACAGLAGPTPLRPSPASSPGDDQRGRFRPLAIPRRGGLSRRRRRHLRRAGGFADQVLDAESRLAGPDPIRPQPPVTWRNTLIVDATGGERSGPPSTNLARPAGRGTPHPADADGSGFPTPPVWDEAERSNISTERGFRNARFRSIARLGSGFRATL